MHLQTINSIINTFHSSVMTKLHKTGSEDSSKETVRYILHCLKRGLIHLGGALPTSATIINVQMSFSVTHNKEESHGSRNLHNTIYGQWNDTIISSFTRWKIHFSFTGKYITDKKLLHMRRETNTSHCSTFQACLDTHWVVDRRGTGVRKKQITWPALSTPMIWLHTTTPCVTFFRTIWWAMNAAAAVAGKKKNKDLKEIWE